MLPQRAPLRRGRGEEGGRNTGEPTWATIDKGGHVTEQAFVISQIGQPASDIRRRADDVFEYIVRPPVEERGLAALRSDLDPTPGQITSRILQSVLEARVVIADLTGRNANVYYELGVVHSFAKPVVILVDRVSSLSFDTQNERVIEIEDEGKIGVSEAEAAKGRLAQALDVVLADTYSASSIVTEVATAQSLATLAPDNPIASELSALSKSVDLLHERILGLPFFPASGPGFASIEEVPVEEMDLTVRTYNALKRAGLETLGDLTALTERDFLVAVGGDRKIHIEVLTKLAGTGLRFKGSF